jgi:hypothetical protein
LQIVPDVYLGDAYLPRGGALAKPAMAWKLAPAVEAVVERVRSGGPPGADEGRFVKGGEAYVQLTLTNFSAESLDQLRKAGLTIMRRDRGDVTGHVAPTKLEAIAELAFVMWITPQ